MAGHGASLFVEVDHDDRWLQPGEDNGNSFAVFSLGDDDDVIRSRPSLQTPQFGGGATAAQPPAFSTPGNGVKRDQARDRQSMAGDAPPATIPVEQVRLPGQLDSPVSQGGGPGEQRFGFSGIHKNIEDATARAAEEQLIRPKFGSFIPIEAFDNEDYEKDIDQVLEEFTASGHYDPMARKRRLQQDRPAEFAVAAEEKGGDTEAAFARPKDAKRMQQNKTLEETEAALRQVAEKANAVSEERTGEEERNKALRSEVKDLKKVFIEVEDKVSDLKREGQSQGQLHAANAAEARKFKELELRMKREEAKRRAIELGLEYEEDEAVIDPALDKYGINKAVKNFRKRLKTWFHGVDSMYRSARKAQSRFGGGVALYFWFFRWIIFVSLFVALVWVGYYIWHFIDFSLGTYSLTLVSFVPVNLYYSSFRFPVSYAACVVGSVGLIVGASVYKFVHEYSLKHDLEIQDANKEPSRYAKLVFTAWDWAIKDKNAAHDQYESIFQSLTVLKREDESAQRIAERSRQDWNRLYTKRAVGLSANFLIILAGWGGIIFSKIYLKDLVGESSGLLGTVLTLLPAVIPSLINLAMPIFTDMCVDLEAWDDPTFVLKMRVGRLYAAKILNALIQVAIILIFFRGPETRYGINRIVLRDCQYYSCEDQAANTFFIAFALDVVISTVAAYFSAVGQYVAFTYVYPWPKQAKTEFLPQRQVIKIFYQQIFVWLCIPHFPFCAIVAPVLWYIQFTVDAHVLFNYNAKPVRPFDAKDTGVYFAVFYTITLFLFLAWFYYVFFFLATDQLDTNCCRLERLIDIGNSTDSTCLLAETVALNGAEVDNTAALCLDSAIQANGFTTANAPTTLFATSSMSVTLRSAMEAAGGFASALAVLANTSLLAWGCALLAVLYLLYSRMRVLVLVEYLEDKVVELTRKQEALGMQIRNKERRIEMIARQKLE